MHTNITEAEQKILKLLWEKGRLSTMQITEKLKDETGWSKQAVISFLRRMETKRLVSYEKRWLPVKSGIPFCRNFIMESWD